MTSLRVLILNSNCLLSAIPTPEEFCYFDYITESMAILIVEVCDALAQEMQQRIMHTYVLPADYVVPSDLPEGAFVVRCDLTQDPPRVYV